MSIYYKEDKDAFDSCLESILINQTVLPTEIVLIKDGPLTDELEGVIEKYQKKFPKTFHIIPFKENQGLGKALQVGVEACKYELIARMDTDDICVHNRFEKQLLYMQQHKDVSIVGGNIQEFNQTIDEPMRLKKMPTGKQIDEYIKLRNPLNHMTVMFRKSDILEVGNYQPLHYLEDHYLWTRLYVNHKIIDNIDEVFVYARIGNGFSERRGSKKYNKGWKTIQKLLYENHIINYFEKQRNILYMFVFTHIPNSLRDFLYTKVLRKS